MVIDKFIIFLIFIFYDLNILLGIFRIRIISISLLDYTILTVVNKSYSFYVGFHSILNY